MLLEDREDQIIVKDINGNIDTKPKTEYFLMKYVDFEGNRIFYQFDKHSWIQETYNEGIFNIVYKSGSMQLRDAEKIIFCINFHKNNPDSKHRMQPFEELFMKNFVDKLETDVLKSILKPFEHRLNFANDAIEIDERFSVDKQGQAYQKFDGIWKSLCIVARTSATNDRFNIDTVIGNIEINAKSLEIIAKVMFLLKPNLRDSVFTSQLSKDNKEQLKRDGF